MLPLARLSFQRYPARMPTLDADAVRAAYRRQASIYDRTFGGVSRTARLCAVSAVNALPGTRVLEVGVGTGLALPHYDPKKRVTGIDLSAEMLALARTRVQREGLDHVEALHLLDAEATGLPEASFDIAALMFVASVVPHPKVMLAELRRIVRPGGHLLFVNHFAAPKGLRRAAERALAPLSRALGWHPHFEIADLLTPADIAAASFTVMPPFGLFTLVHLPVSPPTD